jgi:hypothetical protein
LEHFRKHFRERERGKRIFVYRPFTLAKLTRPKISKNINVHNQDMPYA